MRIVTEEKVVLMRAPGEKSADTAPTRKIKLSWEDAILGIAILVILVSWIQGRLSPDQVLAYLGFTTTGGVWGYVSGAGQNKKK